jgi:hypothetical protein
MNRLNVIVIGMVVVSYLSSCHSHKHREDAPHSETHTNSLVAMLIEKQRAVDLASELHENMTFDQIAKIIPLSATNESPTVEHGGVWYNVPVGSNYYLQLRFEHSSDNRTFEKCRLNLPPQVKSWVVFKE